MATSHRDSLYNGFPIQQILKQWPPHIEKPYRITFPQRFFLEWLSHIGNSNTMVNSYMDSFKNGFSIDRILIQWPPHIESIYVMAIPYWNSS